MFLVIYRDAQGKEQGGLYESREAYYKDTFSPLCEVMEVINFVLSGTTYRERQATARELAIEYSLCEKPDLSYYELYLIGSFFEKVGKRYGLLNEFRENAIC
jgi:hypothetical protein